MILNPVRRTFVASRFWHQQSKCAATNRKCFVLLRNVSTTSCRYESAAPPNNVDMSKQDKQKKTRTLVSKMKKYILKSRDYSKKYTHNNTITPVQAMQEYMLSPSDLNGLRQIRVRSPYVGSASPIMVYLEREVEELAIKVWGSKEALERERSRNRRLQSKQRKQVLFDPPGNVEGDQKNIKSLLTSSQGRVVAYAAAANATIGVFKLACFVSTGSASMFSEMLHSLADTCNQLLLLWGVNESLKHADRDHPYGYGNMRHIMALISGVGIFCIGCGASIYHGVQVLLHPVPGVEFTTSLALGVLVGSCLIEAGSLMVAVNETKKSAAKYQQSFWDYVQESRDPSTNVVLLEDSAAVVGLAVAGGALGLTYVTGNVMFDAVGSIVIGGLLGAVATFLVTTNVNALIGQSIPQERLERLKEMVEDDVCVRGVYDVKATQLGSDEFKFKAEIDFDGREITRAYLASVDLEQVMREIHAVQTMEELEIVLLRYGEHVIDTLGVQIDRIETELKRKNAGLRHIDLEVL